VVSRFAAVGAVVLVALAGFAASAGAATIPGEYIVVLKNGVDVSKKAAKYGLTTDYVYSVPPGFSAVLSDKQRASLGKDSDVVGISANQTLSIPRSVESGAKASEQPVQIVPTGVRRVGGLASPTAKIDGVDQRVDVDVAILDTGLDRKHPDLNVAGGADCTNERKFKPSFDDWDVDAAGHGTAAGGVVGAIDNGIGVVGVAPGARLWGVRVLQPDGFGSVSALLCGIEWVTVHADTIEVANVSLAGRILYEVGCERTATGEFDAVHNFICRSVAAGVTYANSAGNESMDASLLRPTTYDEVIAVSAIADYDGRPGGLADPICDGVPDPPELDDHFASFSNFGPDIDLSAPGACIRTTGTISTGSYYRWHWGTSFSAPHVAGAAALYKARNPSATPAQVRQALIDRRERGPIPGDPDRYNEGILNVAGL
jgi:subtilisin family serine protease